MAEALKIFNIVGARPNLVKIAPLMREMSRHASIQPILVHTGQHYDEKLSDVFFRQMGIPAPDFNLEVGSGSHAWQTAEILKRIEPLLIERKPDLVLVVGDVNSTIAASLASVKLGISVAHVEAGLRSFDRTMPEEINRILTDALADHLFVTEDDAIANLVREGRPCDLPFAVLTLHRPSNVDSVQTLERLLSAIDEIAEELPVIFPVHPRTQERLKEARVKHHPHLRLIPPVGYLDFLCLLHRSQFVLTDSGGIQEETTALGVPCLTLRENTERPITVTEGTNQLVGQDTKKIVNAAREIFGGKAKEGKVPRLWDGHAAERIVEILLREGPRNTKVNGTKAAALRTEWI